MSAEIADWPDHITIRPAKPSEIVRGLPDEQWCRGPSKVVWPDGHTAWCARGILAERAGLGFDLYGEVDGVSYYLMPDSPELALALGFNCNQIAELTHVNDAHGKNAAADLLESWGL